MNNPIHYSLQDAINALDDEMKFNTGGWHLSNISKIKEASNTFHSEQTKKFILVIVHYMRGPYATSLIKFKLAQLLNLLNSYNVSGFHESIDELRQQIHSSYEFMYDSTFKEASQQMIRQLISTPNVVRVQPKVPVRTHRIKTSTPVAKLAHNFTPQTVQLHNAMRQTTPPPQII